MQNDIFNEWVTTKAASQQTGRSIKQIYRYIAAGKVEAVKKAGIWLVKLSDLEALVRGYKAVCKNCGKGFLKTGKRLFCSERCQRRYSARQGKRRKAEMEGEECSS